MEMKESKGAVLLHLDVRCKFVLLFVISVVGLAVRDSFYGRFVFLLVFTLAFLMGQRKKAVKFALAYIAISVLVIFSDYIPVIIQSSILIIALCLRMCIPIMLYAQTFLKTTPVSEMVTGMYALHLPRAFVITFAVAMRFFPTAKEEISQIRDAMALRGIEPSARNVFKRPGVLLEGLMTPLLVRASTVAEELSAASITRGLDNPMPRTAFVKLHLSARDILITGGFIAALLGVWMVKILRG